MGGCISMNRNETEAVNGSSLNVSGPASGEA